MPPPHCPSHLPGGTKLPTQTLRAKLAPAQPSLANPNSGASQTRPDLSIPHSVQPSPGTALMRPKQGQNRAPPAPAQIPAPPQDLRLPVHSPIPTPLPSHPRTPDPCPDPGSPGVLTESMADTQVQRAWAHQPRPPGRQGTGWVPETELPSLWVGWTPRLPSAKVLKSHWGRGAGRRGHELPT